MASITKRSTATGEIRYDVRARIGGRAVTKTFRRRRDADSWRTTLEADQLQGMAVDPRRSRVHLRDYAATWLEDRPELAATTRQDYSKILQHHIGPTFGSKELAAITTPAVRSWWAALSRDHPARAAKSYRLLRTILGTAESDGLIARNPCRVSGAGQERSPERPTASVAEATALAVAMPAPLACLVHLAAWCGLRRGELLALRRRDVDILQRVVHVERSMAQLADGTILIKEPKTRVGRRPVAVPPHLVPVLEAHLRLHVNSSPEALVFTGDKGGPLRANVLQAAWNTARRQVGRPDLHMHDLRHSGNTWAAATGASTAELMARMGHASPAAALRYQHATRERDRAIADALTALVVDPDAARPSAARAMDARWRSSRARKREKRPSKRVPDLDFCLAAPTGFEPVPPP